MLTALAGRRHVVVSGVCLIEHDRVRTAAAHTMVEFRALDRAADRLVRAHGRVGGPRRRLRHPGPRGHAGQRIEGDYLNVVGLPVATLLDLAPELIGD